MSLFQILAVPVAVALFVRSAWSLAKRRGSRRLSLLAATTWFLAALFILRPELTMRLAAVLGIGRGADLVLYVVATLFIATSFHFHSRFRAIESQLTEIVRHLALDRAEHGGLSAPDPEQQDRPSTVT